MMTLSSENHAEQQQQQQTGATVELATLILPSHAADRGLDQEDQVVLEAAHETVENLNEQARISAVVDLMALSELVGCSEQELIADLRMEAGAATTEHHRRNSIIVQEEVEPERRKKGDEEQPLLAGHRPSLLAPDRISLFADPFVLSLAEVLRVTIQSEESQKRDEAIVLAESTLTADGDQNLCHDAFLLNIPNESTGGPLQDHFVLALPEILVDAGLTGSTHTETSQQQHMPFLERAMSLLPTTTHLPTDVFDLHLEAHQEPAVTGVITADEEKEEQHLTLHLDLVVERKVPVIGYVILISGLVALSSVGAALNLQKGPSPTMKTLWRQLATCLVLVPMVLKSLQQEGLPELGMQQWCMLPLAAMAYAYMTLAFVLALDLTTMANAFVFSNMTSLVIIIGRVLLRLPVLPAEGFGAAVGFSGAAVCAQDGASNYESMEHDNVIMVGSSMSGNLIALSASFGTACYLIVAKDLRPKMDLFVFIFCVMLLSSCFLLVSIIVAEEEFSFGMDPTHGLWGWLNPMPDRLPLELYMALVCNCLGTTGYIAVMKYFEPIVPATVMLMEPVVGSLLGVATGTASLPGVQTWIGNVIVGLGTFIVIYSGSSKTEKIDATEALRQSHDDSFVSSVMKSPLIRKNPAKSRHTLAKKVIWDH